MTDKIFSIVIKSVVFYIEDDIQTVSFASDETNNPENYLILQNTIPADPDGYYYEISSREYSGYNGFSNVLIDEEGISFNFGRNLLEKSGFFGLRLHLTDCKLEGFDQLRKALDHIFPDGISCM
ncbi:hypothetical protein [Aquitalea magnusonii]|uniref:hypothetical protein n=1 Tax=Aquitalea magnusonii TaxID=332411 RepID=UPI0011AE5912|nr:hypothetical protein [Aquitalea magnusonii]